MCHRVINGTEKSHKIAFLFVNFVAFFKINDRFQDN